MADGCEDLRRVAFLDLAGILAHGHITNIVRAVFDAPMPSIPRKQECGVRLTTRNTGDGVGNFVLAFPVDVPPPLNATDLSDTRPIQMGGQTGRGLQTASFATTVALVTRLRNRQVRLPLLLGVGGKKPAESRLQSTASVPVDCLSLRTSSALRPPRSAGINRAGRTWRRR